MKFDFEVPRGVREAADRIFGAVLVGGIDKYKEPDLYAKKLASATQHLNWFRAQFKDCIFNNEYAVFYEILMDKKKTSVFSLDQVDVIIETNRDLILKSPYIDIKSISASVGGNMPTEDDIIAAFTANLKSKLNVLSHMEVSTVEFQSNCTVYIEWYKKAFAGKVASAMAAIVSDMGYIEELPNRRSKTYKGLDDMYKFYREKKGILDSLENSDVATSTVIDDKWLEAEVARDKNINDNMPLIDTGIKEVDEVVGKLRRGYILGILGPTKGGKTRFSVHMVYRALEQGYNVAIWPLEGNREEWMAMLESCALANITYEESRKEGKSTFDFISSQEILNREYKGKRNEKRTKVNAIRTLLAGGGGSKYGKISFLNKTAYVEDFLDELQNHYDTVNKFDVIVIDSLVNIMSRTGMPKVDRISEAYMKFKDFVANKLREPALAIVPAQLKQTVVDMIRRNPDETIDVTAGGESAETIRTPDETIGLFSSKQERELGTMHIYSVASRHSANFPDFSCKCALGACFFRSADDEA